MRRDIVPSLADRGPHRRQDGGTIVRVFQPDSHTLELLDSQGKKSLGFFSQLHPDGSFEISVDREIADYRLRATWADGSAWIYDDP